MECDTATTLIIGLEPGGIGSSADDGGGVVFSFRQSPSQLTSGSTTVQGSGDQVQHCSQSPLHSQSSDDSGSAPADSCQLRSTDIQISVTASPILARYSLENTGLTIPFTYLYGQCLSNLPRHTADWDRCYVDESVTDQSVESTEIFCTPTSTGTTPEDAVRVANRPRVPLNLGFCCGDATIDCTSNKGTISPWSIKTGGNPDDLNDVAGTPSSDLSPACEDAASANSDHSCIDPDTNCIDCRYASQDPSSASPALSAAPLCPISPNFLNLPSTDGGAQAAQVVANGGSTVSKLYDRDPLYGRWLGGTLACGGPLDTELELGYWDDSGTLQARDATASQTVADRTLGCYGLVDGGSNPRDNLNGVTCPTELLPELYAVEETAATTRCASGACVQGGTTEGAGAASEWLFEWRAAAGNSIPVTETRCMRYGDNDDDGDDREVRRDCNFLWTGNDNDDSSQNNLRGNDRNVVECGCGGVSFERAYWVGPTCTVYRIRNPARPIFNVTARVQYANGTLLDEVTISTGTLDDQTLNLANSTILQTNLVDSTVALGATSQVRLRLLDLDEPRGSAYGFERGYIVICNDRKDSLNASSHQTFVGSPAEDGTVNPFKSFDDGLGIGRTWQQSTWRELDQKGIIRANRVYPFAGEENPDEIPTYPWTYYVDENQIGDYGIGCNQNGWVHRGEHDYASASSMCASQPGTCVPGLDQSSLGGGRQVTTPCGVARKFNLYEAEDGYRSDRVAGQQLPATKAPEFMPEGWNPNAPNMWVHRLGLYADTDALGANPYTNGDVLLRLELDVAGSLVGVETSVSTGQVRPANDPGSGITSCTIDATTSQGSMVVRVFNTGSVTASYSLTGSCAPPDGTQVTGAPTSFSVGGGGASVLETLTIRSDLQRQADGSPIECTVQLVPSVFFDVILDEATLPCTIVYDGRYNIGTSDTGGVPLPPDPTDGADGQCPTMQWWCDLVGGTFGDDDGELITTIAVWGMIILILLVVVILTISGVNYMLNRDQVVRMRTQAMRTAMQSYRRKLALEAQALQTMR